MSSRRGSRAIGLFLTAVFIGSGFALPALDALLYHSGPASAPAGGHVDLPGGCGAHAEQCALNLLAPLPHLAPATSSEHTLGLSPEAVITAPVLIAPPTYRALLHPSRAPPAAAS